MAIACLVLCLSVVACRLPPVDLGLSLSLIGEDGGGAEGGESGPRFIYFQGGTTTNTAILDTTTMTFSAGPAAIVGIGNNAEAFPVSGGIHGGSYWVVGLVSDQTMFFDPSTLASVVGPNTQVLYGNNANGWVVASGAGAGKIMLRFGQGWAGTNRYNPTTDTFDLAGTSPFATNGGSGTAGSHSFLITNGAKAGQRLVLMGAVDASMYYDGFTDTFSAGPTIGAFPGEGAHTFARGDDYYVMYVGGGATTITVFDPFGETFAAHTPSACAINAGSHTFVLSGGPYSGHFLTVCGSGLQTAIYNPTTFVSSLGPNVTGGVDQGASTVYIDSGPNAETYLIVHGNAGVDTTILDPVTMTTTPGPILPIAINSDVVIRLP